MTAIADLRAKAEAKYPDYTVEFETGKPLVLTGIMSLTDAQLAAFNKAQADLTKLDEDETDLAALKQGFVDLFSEVADDPEYAREALAREELGLLVVLLEEYAGALSAGAKSADAE